MHRKLFYREEMFRISKRKMKLNARFLLIFTLLTLILFFDSSKLIEAAQYIPIGGDEEITYNGIPFDVDGLELFVTKSPYEFNPVETYDLSGYSANKIHILQYSGVATNVPNGVTVGKISVYYDDGSFDAIDLIMGLNTAEWAYDRPENQCCLAHDKVAPAYSFLTNDYTQDFYLGHNFYVYIETQNKPLNYFELSLDPASYTGQPDCPEICTYYHGIDTWFNIEVTAVTLEKISCEVPDGGEPEDEPIWGFGRCGPGEEGIKAAKWGDFTPEDPRYLIADSGEKLEIWCTEDFYFQMFYTPPGGTDSDKIPVGICPWYDGSNMVWFFHSGNSDGNDKPDCLIATKWRSKDYGDNDNENPNDLNLRWMGEPNWEYELCPPGVTECPPAPKLDWATTNYDMNSSVKSELNSKYYYRYGPPVFPVEGDPPPELDDPILIRTIPPPSQPAVSMVKALEAPQSPSPDSYMKEDTSWPCDFDGDGDCDEIDFQIFQNALGTCEGDPEYNPIFNYDINNCIDSTDQYYLFDKDEDGDGIPDAGDTCRKIANLDQADSDADGVGDVCDNCPSTKNRNQLDSDQDGVGDVCEVIDSDNDGIPDDTDRCPKSNLIPTVVINGCDSGVPNTLLPIGCTIIDLITECAGQAINHGDFVSCVARLTNNLKKDGIISNEQKGTIQSCAAQANFP